MSRSAIELLRQARHERYALAALNAVNLETAEAIVEGAERERAPVLLQVSENAARYSSLPRLAALVRQLASEATVPVILHFDHAESVDSAHRALDAGFDSVMLEDREGDPDGYARAVRRLVGLAHDRGAAVEAELDVVRKGDRTGGTRQEPAAVRAFVESTGCDWVAIDIGTEHKQTRKEARLDFARLRSVAEVVREPLVLHGSSGVPASDLRGAVEGGIAKVNLSTALSQAFTIAARDVLKDAAVFDPRSYLGAAREAMASEVQLYVRRLGGSGRADASA